MARSKYRTVTGLTMLALASVTACSNDGDQRYPIATEWVRHLDVSLTLAGDDLAVAGPAYVAGLNEELGLGLSADDEYRSLGLVAGRDGLRHARLQQVHAGVPVHGAQLVVHADETTFIGLNGYVTKHLDGFDVRPAIDEAAALATARTERAPGRQISFDERADLVIMPRPEGGALLAWRIDLYNEPQDGLTQGRWVYFVDAANGTVARSFDALNTLEQASGPGGNPKKSRSWAAELDVEPMDGQFAMQTARLETYDLANGTMQPAMTVRGPLDPIGDAAINDAHGYAEVTLNMMRDWFGHNSIDDNGFVIVSRVHYSEGYENASWNGREMTYGDGAEKFYPLSGSVDVVAHEINHGFTTFHSDLEYAGMSGGLNESFSDIAGALAEVYIDGSAADFDIGEDIFRDDGALRYMCDPRKDHAYYKEEYGLDDFGSIDYAGDFTREMDVHLSSGVPNKAFCLSVGRFRATTSGGNATDSARKVGAAWYLANASYWTTSTDFIAGCQGVVDAARALGYSSEEVSALADSWADVGVSCEGQTTSCDDDGECEIDAGETCASCSEDCDSCSQDCGWFKKLKCKVGIGDCSRCDAPEGCGDGLCGEDETDESCARDCGCAADSCDSVAPFGCWCDATCEQSGDCCDDADDAC